MCKVTAKVAHEPKAETTRTYPGSLSMKHNQKYCYSPLDGILVHRRVTPPSSMSLSSIYPCLGEERQSEIKEGNNATGEA